MHDIKLFLVKFMKYQTFTLCRKIWEEGSMMDEGYIWKVNFSLCLCMGKLIICTYSVEVVYLINVSNSSKIDYFH